MSAEQASEQREKVAEQSGISASDLRTLRQIAYDIGWLEGFSGAMWAMCEVQEKDVVSAEMCAAYETVVGQLRKNVLGIESPDWIQCRP